MQPQVVGHMAVGGTFDMRSATPCQPLDFVVSLASRFRRCLGYWQHAAAGGWPCGWGRHL